MRYFNLTELGATSEKEFHPGFIEHLDALRHAVGKPFNITSGARTEKHNTAVGGTPKSLHISDKPQHSGQKGCMAVDIAATDPAFKLLLVKTALQMGWSVGINDKKRFLHIDRRTDIGIPQAVFTY